MKTTLVATVAALAFSIGAAFATPLLPARGVISAVNGDTLSVTETSGAQVSLTLASGAKISEVLPASLADVKPGTYVGTAAVRQPSGVYRAMELQIFPDSMRGVGLGTRAWNLAPHSTMTNGTIGGLSHSAGTVGSVSGTGDLTLTVNDGTGAKTVLIPQGVPVITYAPGTPADLHAGAHVIFFAMPGADGGQTISRISVGKNGLVPPM